MENKFVNRKLEKGEGVVVSPCHGRLWTKSAKVSYILSKEINLSMYNKSILFLNSTFQ
jgi:hypothetical protein